MVDGGQKSGIWDSMQDKEGFGLYIVNPKKSETERPAKCLVGLEKNKRSLHSVLVSFKMTRSHHLLKKIEQNLLSIPLTRTLRCIPNAKKQ